MAASFSSSGISGGFNENFRTPFSPVECQVDPSSPECQAATVAQDAAIRAAAGEFTGGYKNTLSDIFKVRYPTFKFGVTIDIPVGNKTARANLGRALVEGQQKILAEIESNLDLEGVDFETVEELGDPVSRLIAVCEINEADVLVVGRRGAGLAERVILGSVADRLCHLASCPVLVVP